MQGDSDQVSSTVYVAMVGDLLHAGHINILETASKLGVVTVGVMTDDAAMRYKRLPFMSYEDRVRVIRSIRGVTKVVPQNTLSYEENLRAHRPNFVVHGDDWRGGIQAEIRRQVIETLAEWGGSIVEVPYTKGISSTLLHRANHEDGFTADMRQGRLKRLLGLSRTIRIIEAHNGLSAIVASNSKSVDDRICFDALWHSSFTDAVMRGKPNRELVEKGHRLQTIDEIFECTQLPLIYDGESGGTPDQTYELCRALDKLGVSGVSLGTRALSKQSAACRSAADQEQIAITTFVKKIEAFRAASKSGHLMHFSRIDILEPNESIRDALARANAFLEAGSNGILIHSTSKTADGALSFCRELRKNGGSVPVLVAPTESWDTHYDIFQDNGVNGIIYADQLMRSIVKPLRTICQSILSCGKVDEDGHCDDLTSAIELRHLVPPR